MAMNREKVRRRKKRGPNNKTGMILISIVLILVFLVTMFRVITLKNTQKTYDEKEEYYNQLVEEEKKRSEDLVEFEKYTQTNAYIEEVAKEKFGLVKDGEIIFVAEE